MSLSWLPAKEIFTRLFLVILLIILILIGAVPGYWQGGKWSWLEPPQVDNLNQIRQIRTEGLELPNWRSLQQQEVTIGGNKWSVQLLEKPNHKPVMLLLSPQNYYLDKPEVEWMDINGLERWKTDSYQKLRFSVPTDDGRHKPLFAERRRRRYSIQGTRPYQTAKVTARFFRAWNSQQTFAVVQWYGFPQSGHYSPAQWFWRDQLVQLRRRRVPWVAVCLKIPIEPLGDLTTARPLAKSLAKTVQARLQASAFGHVWP